MRSTPARMCCTLQGPGGVVHLQHYTHTTSPDTLLPPTSCCCCCWRPDSCLLSRCCKRGCCTQAGAEGLQCRLARQASCDLSDKVQPQLHPSAAHTHSVTLCAVAAHVPCFAPSHLAGPAVPGNEQPGRYPASIATSQHQLKLHALLLYPSHAQSIPRLRPRAPGAEQPGIPLI